MISASEKHLKLIFSHTCYVYWLMVSLD